MTKFLLLPGPGFGETITISPGFPSAPTDGSYHVDDVAFFVVEPFLIKSRAKNIEYDHYGINRFSAAEAAISSKLIMDSVNAAQSATYHKISLTSYLIKQEWVFWQPELLSKISKLSNDEAKYILLFLCELSDLFLNFSIRFKGMSVFGV